MMYRLPSLRPVSVALAASLCLALPAHALVNGTDTSNFNAVGAIGIASGVLIADNWVLTAGHVASGLGAGTMSFEALTGSAVIDAIYTYSTAAFPNNDIALLHLASPIAAALPVLNDQVVKASQVSSLGALRIATAQNQTPNGVGSTTASTVKSSYTDSTGTSYTVNWLITNGQAYLQGGDSGAALFKGAVSDSGGAVLLGVASAALTDSNGAPESAFVQVASYKTWINNTMASSGQQAVWSSTSPVPEPSTASMYLLSGLAAIGLVWGRSAWRMRQAASRPN
jgi:hypothetical protein